MIRRHRFRQNPGPVLKAYHALRKYTYVPCESNCLKYAMYPLPVARKTLWLGYYSIKWVVPEIAGPRR